MTVHSLGFPRIGAHRETKFSVESFWRGEIGEAELKEEGRKIRQQNWSIQHQTGLRLLPVGDFSWYDHVLDLSMMLGVIPERFQAENDTELTTYFKMARGKGYDGEEILACEMTKWFDTNYHYIVPELHPEQEFSLKSSKLFDEIREAQALNYQVKPVLIGPLTYLWLSKLSEPGDKLSLLPKFLVVYQKLLAKLAALHINWVQIDEPILVLDLPPSWQQAFKDSYANLQQKSLKLMVTTYFGGLGSNLLLSCHLPVNGLHIDCVRSPSQLSEVIKALPEDRVLSVGIVNGRNIWKTNINHALTLLKPLHEKLGDRLWIGGSCSFLHSPVDLEIEKKLDNELKEWLAFAKQKTAELVILGNILEQGEQAFSSILKENKTVFEKKQLSTKIHNKQVQARLEKINQLNVQRTPFSVRQQIQQKNIKLPLFPTTTIGSFPQTAEIRRLRRDQKAGALSSSDYMAQVKDKIRECIEIQEKLGLDVLVHGESERNDMVEYFGEQLEGFAFTQNGWVQSYGSRCVKPPIIFGDVSRPHPMTVDWIRYAQSLTDKPVKGMLTGPVTMTMWSFIREDQPFYITARQIALALHDEVCDLEKAGIQIIQIDEPAFREGLPLLRQQWDSYLQEAIFCFKLVSCDVADHTQIHTHMCYSEFNDIIDAIAAMDSDVISIETSRSNMELLTAFQDFCYPNGIGPGVYDVHSPRVPHEDEIIQLMENAASLIPKERLWVNPDCGLKTRNWAEVKPAIQNMVKAALFLREKYSQ
ncbi:5-methyltetrahydropteroyltriglutamate--homocysteine S-methyltransferase [Legionella cardiaca]|uniref:5-methyltetrahydropteroyltriglutamate--homocysteine methyltransferase n=1 Tax=Legionella cardiaca TaxID=1071983 RepID=A0ABY8AW59_9GAMM|nr:5-methyltetrahydropteroyltriglutamate--homocysteine S-methyltransferase [Legionella cardiaca]WED44713.1 5-methyltetrahydropteroyltriglutamate--homocysteine S-methyltransferase [Legionella cardiaca]